jgi:hypothetical protein
VNDDWRVRVEISGEGAAAALSKRLEAFDLAHDLKTAFQDRVIVSRDGPDVFCYAGSREQAEAARRAVRSLASEHDWKVEFELERWHPVAERWERPDQPLPASDADRAAERAGLIAQEREESREQGFPEYEVQVRCSSPDDAKLLAQRLASEGIPSAQRWQFVMLGAADEQTAHELAERIRREAPDGSTVTAAASAQEVVQEAPFATPFSPFSVLGGMGG